MSRHRLKVAGDMDRRMIHQVAADTRPIQLHSNAMLPQMLCWSNSGQHQQPWRMQRARGHDHVVSRDRLDAAITPHLSPARSAIREQNAPHLSIAENLQV